MLTVGQDSTTAFNADADSFGDLKVCYLTTFLGDYHAPRIKRLADDLAKLGGRLKIAQFHDRSSLYSHPQERRRKFLESMDVTRFQSPKGLRFIMAIYSFLRRERPNHVFVLGYSNTISLTCLAFSPLFRYKIYFMSESKADDQPRRWITEFIKRKIVRLFDGALVGGERHKRYFQSLGMRRKIEIGFDVVDNSYFCKAAEHFRRKRALLVYRNIFPDQYILCVSRLVDRKRIDRTLNIYAGSGISDLGYKLVVIGDGPEAANFRKLVEDLGLSEDVIHVPSVKNHLMPAFYSNATAIILASEYDQWGLCINEAMACGVPAIISSRCGAAHEIVHESTGVIFDGEDLGPAVAGLRRIVTDRNYAASLRNSCLSQMDRWGLANFGSSAINLIRGNRLSGL